MESSSEQFISRIKKTSEREMASRKVGESRRLAGLLRFFGWFVIALGFVVTLGFFILMESVYGQLGATANSQLAATMESTAQLREISASVGLDWFPPFMKIYSIRYPIVLALAAATACLGFALLYSARTKKDSQ